MALEQLASPAGQRLSHIPRTVGREHRLRELADGPCQPNRFLQIPGLLCSAQPSLQTPLGLDGLETLRQISILSTREAQHSQTHGQDSGTRGPASQFRRSSVHLAPNGGLKTLKRPQRRR